MADHARRDLGPIRLGVIDDHPLIATAIEAAITGGGSTGGRAGTSGGAGSASSAGHEGRRPIEIVGVAGTVDDGLALINRTGDLAADVVLCDLQLDTGAATDGLALLDAAGAARTARGARSADPAGPRMIILTSFDRSSFMRAAFERGAVGFLAKTTDPAEILRAVRVVAEGGTAFSAGSLESVRSAPRPPSERETEILRAVQGGATSEEIGGHLGISARTVESHVRRLFDRYGVVSRTELVVLAMREGWLPDRS